MCYKISDFLIKKIQNIYEPTNFYEQNLIPNWG